MKWRLTFLDESPGGWQDIPIRVHDSTASVAIQPVGFVQEHRLTLEATEIPPEISDALRLVEEFDFHFIPAWTYQDSSLFPWRLPPGRHLRYRLQSDQPASLPHGLLSWLGLDAAARQSIPQTQNGTFNIHYEVERDGSPLTLSGLTPDSWLVGQNVSEHQSAALVFGKWCKDQRQLTLSRLFCTLPGHEGRASSIGLDHYRGADLEIGVFHHDDHEEPGHLSLAGSIYSVGKDVSAVMFQFPARHQPAGPGYWFSMRLVEPHGLHPKLRLEFGSKAIVPPRDSCQLFSYWTLPSALFVDQYQLSERLMLQSSGLTAVHTLRGAVDLEAPEWAIEEWGSVLLLELGPAVASGAGSGSSSFFSELPTHSRYMSPQPVANGSTATFSVPYPAIFWACDAVADVRSGKNPWDADDLEYVQTLGRDKVYYNLRPKPGPSESLYLSITIPVLDSDRSRLIEIGTGLVILSGVLIIVYKLVMVAIYDWRTARTRRGRGKKVQ